MRTQVSWKRVAALLLAVMGVLAVVFTAYAAFRLRELDRMRRVALRQPPPDARNWLAVARSMVLPKEIHQLAFVSRARDDEGFTSVPRPFEGFTTQCTFYGLSSARSPVWTRFREGTLAGARCEDLDALVLAARTGQLDDLTPAAADDPHAHLRVQAGLASLVARSRLRMEHGDTAGAEEDLRAVLSIGLALQRSPDFLLLLLGNRALRTALDHLAAVYESTGKTEPAALARSLVSSIPSPESCRGPIRTGFMIAGTIPEGARDLAAVARDRREPLAVRVRAIAAIGWGYLSHPKEVLSGADRSRREILEALRQYPELAPWLAQAEGTLNHEPFARLRFASLW